MRQHSTKNFFKIIFFIIFLSLCKKNDYKIDNFYQELNLNQLPWKISPMILKEANKPHFVELSNEKIEFWIHTNEKEENTFFKDYLPTYIFKFQCYFKDDLCIIFRIEKIGNPTIIQQYYQKFIEKNQINKEKNLIYSNIKEKKTPSKNTIIEKQEIFETDEYIIPIYITETYFPKDISKIPIEDNSDIEIRIYSKALNPNIESSNFIENLSK